MKYVRFYLEHKSPKDKRKGSHCGTVFAAFDTMGDDFKPRFDGEGYYVLDGLGAVFAEPNSPVASTAASTDYLHQKCKRISEAEAREIHPALFERLDAEES